MLILFILKIFNDVGKFHKLCHTQLLGALLEHSGILLIELSHRLGRYHASQRVAQRLATLAKGCLDHALE